MLLKQLQHQVGPPTADRDPQGTDLMSNVLIVAKKDILEPNAHIPRGRTDLHPGILPGIPITLTGLMVLLDLEEMDKDHLGMISPDRKLINTHNIIIREDGLTVSIGSRPIIHKITPSFKRVNIASRVIDPKILEEIL